MNNEEVKKREKTLQIFIFILNNLLPIILISPCCSTEIEDVLSQKPEVPAALEIEGCSCSRVEVIMKAVASELRGSVRSLDLLKLPSDCI